MEQMYKDLSKHFNGAQFLATYDYSDAAWLITTGSEKPFRVGDEDAREKSYDEILQDAIKHFEGDE